MAVTNLLFASGHRNTPALSAGSSISKTMASNQPGSYRVFEGYPKLCHHIWSDWNSLHKLGRCRLRPFSLNQEPKFLRDWALPDYVRCFKCCLAFCICTVVVLWWNIDSDAVEYFVGKKLPFGYFPSFCVGGPKEHCQLLRRKCPHWRKIVNQENSLGWLKLCIISQDAFQVVFIPG
jgi:hypothetical protein